LSIGSHLASKRGTALDAVEPVGAYLLASRRVKLVLAFLW
jgi:hypothetical protein